MNTRIKNEAIEYAKLNLNEEACGLITCGNGKVHFIKCQNISIDKINHFEISAEDYLDAAKWSIPYGIFHSHPIGQKIAFSDDDKELSEIMMLPVYLFVHETGEWLEYYPLSKEHKIESVQFDWGINDCLGLVRHYYQKNFGILIKDYDRDESYEDSDNEEMLLKFADEGFIETNTKTILHKHDVLLFNSMRAYPQHLGIFIGNSKMIHHPIRQLSQTAMIEARMLSKLSKVLRHKSLF